MQLIRGHQYLPSLRQGAVATIGNFDGLHRGHQHIIQHVTALARQQQRASIVISFEPTPKEYFMGLQAPARIYNLRAKLELLSALQPDYFVMLRFNHTLATLQAETFVHQILHQPLNIKQLLVGDDFKFGYQRQGDIHLLQQMGLECGFEVSDINTIAQHGERVSSTLIREKLAAGLFTQAAELLTRPFTISGKVFHGDKKGRTMGFPTANILLKRRTLPISGVFAVTVTCAENHWQGIANIGHRPTVSGTRDQCEVHLFACDDDLYGQRLTVCPHMKIREEIKFSSLESLRQQIHIDIDNAKHYFSKGHSTP
ncbi:MAG: bifunctional riboflavin kinase/FAD synthetase [Candidatus Thioglobus sp.]|nr:MAG: bifunctional riboflavin kinase/FAD synthetase [Candidatus Thioglobus sp.]|tara:strand:- start:1218 stop:2156 length:939 start_codon:yes stop_codon:yes gene_type:complete